MRIAALDLGSNTFLCLIADFQAGKLVQVFSDEARFVRLGQDVGKTGRIQDVALQKCDLCLQEFRQQIERYKVDKVFAVATSAAREAENSEDFFTICQKNLFTVEIISGQQEAELTFLGGTFDLPTSLNTAVVDVGGGSTEIIFSQADLENSGGTKITGTSLELGGVRLTEKWVKKHPISKNDLANIEKNISEQLGFFKQQVLHGSKAKIDRLVAVAGTPTTLVAMIQEKDYSAESIQGTVLKRKTLQNWAEKLASMSLDERIKLPGLEKGRADIIVAAIMVLIHVLDSLSLDKLMVSIKGVRYGLAIKGARGKI